MSAAAIEATGLVKYDAMQHAIIAAQAVDEVKDIRDKAMALEKYAQQARNFEAERRAAQIRIRAELKGGELLKAQEKAKRGPNKLNGQGSQRERSDAKTLKELGVSETQSSRWQQLAENPKAVERYLRDTDDVPTTAGALAAAAPAPKPVAREVRPPPFSDEALWVNGRLRDLAERGLKPSQVAKGCDEQLSVTTKQYIDALMPWLRELRGLL